MPIFLRYYVPRYVANTRASPIFDGQANIVEPEEVVTI